MNRSSPIQVEWNQYIQDTRSCRGKIRIGLFLHIGLDRGEGENRRNKHVKENKGYGRSQCKSHRLAGLREGGFPLLWPLSLSANQCLLLITQRKCASFL